MHKRAVLRVSIFAILLITALAAHVSAGGPGYGPPMQTCAPAPPACAPAFQACAPQMPVCAPRPACKPKFPVCNPDPPCSPPPIYARVCIQGPPEAAVRPEYARPPVCARRVGGCGGAYPLYRMNGLLRAKAGCMKTSTHVIAMPFRVLDDFFDVCAQPPKTMPGPVQPYRAYCTPPVVVSPWGPSPYVAPPGCPPMISLPSAKPVPGKVRKSGPRRRLAPMAQAGTAPVAMYSQPGRQAFSARWQ
jgi:hypothetical protein